MITHVKAKNLQSHPLKGSANGSDAVAELDRLYNGRKFEVEFWVPSGDVWVVQSRSGTGRKRLMLLHCERDGIRAEFEAVVG